MLFNKYFINSKKRSDYDTKATATSVSKSVTTSTSQAGSTGSGQGFWRLSEDGTYIVTDYNVVASGNVVAYASGYTSTNTNPNTGNTGTTPTYNPELTGATVRVTTSANTTQSISVSSTLSNDWLDSIGINSKAIKTIEFGSGISSVGRFTDPNATTTETSDSTVSSSYSPALTGCTIKITVKAGSTLYYKDSYTASTSSMQSLEMTADTDLVLNNLDIKRVNGAYQYSDSSVVSYIATDLCANGYAMQVKSGFSSLVNKWISFGTSNPAIKSIKFGSGINEVKGLTTSIYDLFNDCTSMYFYSEDLLLSSTNGFDMLPDSGNFYIPYTCGFSAVISQLQAAKANWTVNTLSNCSTSEGTTTTVSDTSKFPSNLSTIIFHGTATTLSSPSGLSVLPSNGTYKYPCLYADNYSAVISAFSTYKPNWDSECIGSTSTNTGTTGESVTYSAGNGISISNNTISTKIGDGLGYDSNGKITVTATTSGGGLTASDILEGDNITITDNGDGTITINSTGSGGGGDNPTTISTLTFKSGSTSSFKSSTYNGTADRTVSIPTKTSHLTNDSKFITSANTVNSATTASSAETASSATTSSSADTWNGFSDYFELDGNSLKCLYPFYSIGEVSAFGSGNTPTSSGSGGGLTSISNLVFKSGSTSSFNSTTYDGKTQKTISIPTKTSHLVNDSNFITSNTPIASATTASSADTWTGFSQYFEIDGTYLKCKYPLYSTGDISAFGNGNSVASLYSAGNGIEITNNRISVKKAIKTTGSNVTAGTTNGILIITGTSDVTVTLPIGVTGQEVEIYKNNSGTITLTSTPSISGFYIADSASETISKGTAFGDGERGIYKAIYTGNGWFVTGTSGIIL